MKQRLREFSFRILPVVKFCIKGDSMKPTLLHGDIVLVNKLAYLFNKPQPGEIVIAKQKNYRHYLIKRVKRVQKNTLFIVGDNKEKSIDSRKFGWIEQKDIIGKVMQ